MSRRSRDLVSAVAVAVLFGLPLLPEILGTRLLVFRDTQITHWPWHREAVRQLVSGRVPFVNPAASGGQPLLANPNAVLLYPTFLLARVLSPVAAFNAHYLLHVLWAFFGARALARRLGLGSGGALVAGVAYGFSGMMLSYGSAFMNSSAAAAWLPWCGAALVDLGRAPDGRTRARSAVAAGLAMGLQLLAGEPAISLITIAVGGALLVGAARTAPRGQRATHLGRSLRASVGAGALAIALAAPLLLPLRAVFPLTYRGQHSFSEKASGASAFTASRALEWVLPRIGGSPDVLDSGIHWLRSRASEDFVYIWCVTFGVVPLLILVLAAVRREFWDRRSVALASGGVVALLLAFGFALPFYRLLYAAGAFRRLRYPIKFYLVTTVAVALLSGLAAESLGRRRAGRREIAVLAAALGLFAAAWVLSAPGSALDRLVAPLSARASEDPAAVLPILRSLVRGDALIGVLATLAIALVLRWPGARPRDPAWAIAGLALVSSFPWGLPLFVSAPASPLLSPPALSRRLEGPGRIYVSRRLPQFDLSVLRGASGDEPLRMGRVARILVEQLVPLTGAPYGARYLFETDPDGSYGYYNRIASEAADASSPVGRDRLLVLYGARWALAEDGEEHPLFRPVTGLEVAGRRLVLFEAPEIVPELRWAGRTWHRPGLSASLELLRSERFDPRTDLALAGPAIRGSGRRLAAEGRVAIESVRGRPRRGDRRGRRRRPPRLLADVLHGLEGLRGRRPAPVLVANSRDLAVAVPPGRHRVEFAWDARAVPLRRRAPGPGLCARRGRGRSRRAPRLRPVEADPGARAACR